MSTDKEHRVRIELYLSAADVPAFFERLGRDGYFAESLTIQTDMPHSVRIQVLFTDPLHAALVLAAMSNDKERAAQFKMFWGGQ